MYLIYKDENGVKVARNDGRLDECVSYYPTIKAAIDFVSTNKNHLLDERGVVNIKIIDNDISTL